MFEKQSRSITESLLSVISANFKITNERLDKAEREIKTINSSLCGHKKRK